MARTAVIAGTASAVNGRVQRRQAAKFADRDAETAAQQQQAYQQYADPPPEAAPAPEAPADPLQQLSDLGDLKDRGLLTDAEFAAQKAKILGL
ncbi:SHOCT domain-containing protein [Nocardioides sp. P5_C9_2]